MGLLLFENRKLEIKENYNSYNEIDNPKGLSVARWKFRLFDYSIIRLFPKFLAKRIRAHDGCLGIGRL